MRRLKQSESKRTNINQKILEGIEENGWKMQTGIGTGVYNPDATYKTMVAPLVDYLKKKEIEVK